MQATYPSRIRMVWAQIRHQNSMFWRNPISAFFTLVLPAMFLVLFGALFGDQEIRGVPFPQFFTPAIATFAAVSATFTNLAIGTALARDQGILKRVRGTPLPRWSYMAGRIGSGVWLATISVVVMFLIGWLFYDIEVLWNNIHIAALTFVVGIGTFSALGLAIAGLVRNGDAVPAVAQAIILPMAFVSDIFIVPEDPPAWLDTTGDLFPLKHFATLFGDAFNPLRTEPVLGWGHIAVMLVWGLASLLVAIRFFSWEPSR